jgi:hypothetical protein
MSDRHNAELVRTIGKTSVLRAMGVAAVAVVGACSGGDHWEGGVADVEVIEIASEAPAADPGKLTVCSATMTSGGDRRNLSRRRALLLRRVVAGPGRVSGVA